MSSNLRPPSVDSLCVLIVDDEHRLRDMLSQALTDMGYQSISAKTAEQALKLLESSPIDIAVVDLNLPQMGGMQLFEEMGRRWPKIQVIILTGFGDLAAAQRAIRLGVVDFLTKPCVLSDLEVALNRARHRLGETVEVGANPLNTFPEESDLALSLEQVEHRHIMSVLHKNDGNRTATATELGISQRKLYYHLARYRWDD